MKLALSSIMVIDQEHALRFYTQVLGFIVKNDVPMGEFRWLTVVSPEGVNGMELVLEPMNFPPAREYQKALFDAGIPATAFFSSDIHADYRRLTALGVAFRGPPTSYGPITTAIFEDTCGNWINLVQPADSE